MMAAAQMSVGKGWWGQDEDLCILKDKKVERRDSNVDRPKKKKSNNDTMMLRAGVIGETENNARQHRGEGANQLALRARLYNKRMLLSLHC